MNRNRWIDIRFALTGAAKPSMRLGVKKYLDEIEKVLPLVEAKHDDKYPEHRKLVEIKIESQALGGFLEWLAGQDLAFCENLGRREERWEPVRRSIDQWLALYHGIDLNKLYEEKEEMLHELRQAQAREVTL